MSNKYEDDNEDNDNEGDHSENDSGSVNISNVSDGDNSIYVGDAQSEIIATSAQYTGVLWDSYFTDETQYTNYVVNTQNDTTASASLNTPSASYSVELRDNQKEITRFYNALFDRNPDKEGLVYWVNALADKEIGGGGSTIQNVAQSFSLSAEFQTLYGSNVSNADFINLMYQNILDRAPDEGGYSYWLSAINQSGDRGEMIVSFSNSAEYVEKTAVLVDTYLVGVSLEGYVLG